MYVYVYVHVGGTVHVHTYMKTSLPSPRIWHGTLEPTEGKTNQDACLQRPEEN